MRSKVTRRSEPHPTVLTQERLFTSVGSTDVLLQTAWSGERLVTVSAGVRLLTEVASAMHTKSIRPGKSFITLGARERLLAGVHTSMYGQIRSSTKRAAAVPTLEGPVSGVHCSDVA